MMLKFLEGDILNTEMLNKYARLIVKTGVNIQKDQTLVVSCPVECAWFARLVAEIAYKEGAREVVINWKDELLSKIKFAHAPEEVFDEFPQWRKEFFNYYAKIGAAFISIYAEDPDLLSDVDPERISRASKASRIALKEYNSRLMNNRNPWCVVSIPTPSWAKKVFPDLSEEEAVSKLWDAILRSVRVDADDPVKAWDEHKEELKKNIDILNRYDFKELRFKNSIGTDLTIRLPEGHIWLGGSEFTSQGTEFIANMPTEEIFTLPAYDGVDGTVVSSMPLSYNGNLIEDIVLKFKDGRIVDYSASKGYESLKQLIETDEGSHYLGEVALVPFNSPISNMNILFYNTLFDENASCHLAIGEAYPVCLKDGDTMSKEELKAAKVNSSLVHVDFMIGTKDLEIEGITKSGDSIKVFEGGDFAI